MKNKIIAVVVLAVLFVIMVAVLNANALSNFYGQQVVRLYGILTLSNTSGTAKFSIDSNGLTSLIGNTGTKVIGSGDSANVTITGLTTSGIVAVWYKGSQTLGDTACSYSVWSTNTLSVYGKFGKTVAYSVLSK